MMLVQPPEVRLLDRAIVGVLKAAQDGELPLFAWTLGLPLSEWRVVVGQSLAAPAATTGEARFLVLLRDRPQAFGDLVDLFIDCASPACDPLRARWTAHVLAAACLGNRHLWEDLGLSGPQDVSMLVKHYFEPLHRRKDANLRWKRFLFLELGARRGEADMRPPGCARCGDFPLCFGDSEKG